MNIPPISADHPDAWPMPTETDLQNIGAAFLTAIAITNQLGHASPASTLDYSTFLESDQFNKDTDTYARMIRDFIAWTSGRNQLSPDAEGRLRSYVARTGWQAMTQEVSQQVAS